MTTLNNKYGFETTNEVKYDRRGFFVGKYTVYANEEIEEANGISVNYNVLTGEHAGDTCQVYYNTLSDNTITAKIAQQDLKRIADATGKPVDSKNPVQGRTFIVDVVQNPKDDRYTNVKAYLPQEGGVPAGVAKAAAEVKGDLIPF